MRVPRELITSEADLYPLVDRYLHQGFADAVKPRYGVLRVVTQIIPHVAGQVGGRWSQPDLAAAVITRCKYEPCAVIELHSFEVKRSVPIDLEAVHEALAHTRFVHYSHLVWDQSQEHAADRLQRVRDNCEVHGVGLILARDPWDAVQGYSIVLPAQRRARDAAAIDDFIEERFSSDAGKQVLAGLRSLNEVGK